MDIWYRLVETVFPFSWASYDFMKNALAAVIMVTPIFSLMGTMVVNNRMAFFSDSIGHAGLTGIAIGVLMGLANPLTGMLILAVVMAVAITGARLATDASADTVIGVFSATAVALGVVILSRGGGFAKYSRYLIGDLLSITPRDLAILFVVLVLVLIVWGLMFNEIMLIGVNPSLARSRGVRVELIETVFTLILAVVVTVSIQWVGILIINALLVLPAAAARNLAGNVRSYHFYSFLITLFCGLAGLILSYYWGTATGATIVLLIAAVYFLTLMRARSA